MVDRIPELGELEIEDSTLDPYVPAARGAKVERVVEPPVILPWFFTFDETFERMDQGVRERFQRRLEGRSKKRNPGEERVLVEMVVEDCRAFLGKMEKGDRGRSWSAMMRNAPRGPIPHEAGIAWVATWLLASPDEIEDPAPHRTFVVWLKLIGQDEEAARKFLWDHMPKQQQMAAKHGVEDDGPQVSRVASGSGGAANPVRDLARIGSGAVSSGDGDAERSDGTDQPEPDPAAD